jgi:homoserine O-succinyltransferase/O-acetyltransferase
MPFVLETPRSAPAAELRGRQCLTIGLVNNMPDAACDATERQFVELIRAATPRTTVRLRLFSIAAVPRADRIRQRLAARYHDIAELWAAPLDGLIVTGTEPRAANLKDEPYWPALAKLVDWAGKNTTSTIWSCLAAHAAVLRADGIERRPFKDKLVGVFDCDKATDHPLLAGVAPRQHVPHSRANDLAEPALTSCGYRVLTRSAEAGVDAFVREEQGSSLFLFFQGHPEYEADSLLREYRRDVGRFLRGEWQTYPAAPQGYLSDRATVLADCFRARAVGERRANMITEFPMAALEAGAENTWRNSAVRTYQNWIDYLKDRQRARRQSAVGVQDAGRNTVRAPAGTTASSRIA